MSHATAGGSPPAAAASAIVIAGLGIVQILAWGSSYYLLAVLAAPIAAEIGWPLSQVVAGFSVAMAVSGVAAPRVGRMISEWGGRPVLLCGCLLIAAGQCILGLATNPALFFAAWFAIGLGMSGSLYDAAFSTLGRLYGTRARQAISALTLFGGFASTVCWPLSAFLANDFGWRGACFIYAAVQLLVSFPIIWFCIPKEARRLAAAQSTSAAPRGQEFFSRRERLSFVILAIMLAAGGMIASLISVHLLTILQSKELSLAAAVALGAFVGPSQVGSRIVEMALGRRYHPIWTLLTAASLLAAGVVMLFFGMPILAAAILCYGAGNGIWSIARGTVPLATFRPERYAVIMGKLAMPSLIAQASAPFLGALTLEYGGAGMTLAFLALLAGGNVILAFVLLNMQKRPRE